MTIPERRTSLVLTDAALFATSAVWGAQYAVIKWVVVEISPMAFTALRYAAASLLILLVAWWIERDLSIPRRDWGFVLLLGFVGNFLAQVFLINGIQRLTATTTGFIMAARPLFVGLTCAALKTEKIGRRGWLGICIGFSGVFLLIGGSDTGLRLDAQSLVGSLLILGAAWSWSAYTVLARQALERTTPLRLTAWTMLTSVPFLLLLGLPELRTQNWAAVTPNGWLGMAYSILLSLVVGMIIWNWGVQRVGSAGTAIYSYTQPLVSFLVGSLFLHETLHPLQGLGAVAILVGVGLGRHGVAAE